MTAKRYSYYDFFAGGGMAGLGLGRHWECTMANDICSKKASAYEQNFAPARELVVKDINEMTPDDLPGDPLLAWASFPCQDLSLAGERRGLAGRRSSTFWPFWSLMQDRVLQRSPIQLIALENVVGAITSHDGWDFQAILQCLWSGGYQYGAIVIDAVHFLPQSRPRLFIVAAQDTLKPPAELMTRDPNETWHPGTIRAAYTSLPEHLKSKWVWWNMPTPTARCDAIEDIIEWDTDESAWHSADYTKRLLDLMSESNRAKVRAAQREPGTSIGTLYRRTRRDKRGSSVQRAEVRFDHISGCLRTPTGGSSRQTVLFVQENTIRSRLLTPREAARLMGVPDWYQLPQNYNDAYHLMGDGLAVPVVSWLAQRILTPLAGSLARATEAA